MKVKDISTITSGIYVKPVATSLQPSVYIIQARDYDEFLQLRTDLQPTILKDKKTTKHILSEGDILVMARGDEFSAISFQQEIYPAVASSTFLIIRKLDFKKVLSEYLAWYINLPKTQHYLKSLAKGTSITAINKNILGDLQVPIPSLENQKTIVALSKLMREEKQLQTRLNELKNILINQQLLNLLKDEKN